MEIGLLLSKAILVMVFLIVLGVVSERKGIINEDGARMISNLLLMIVIPGLVLHSFQIEKHPELMPGVWGMLVLATVAHALTAFIAKRIFPDTEDGRGQVARAASVLSNCGFMGFPLLSVVAGPAGPLYGVVFLFVFNIFTWVWSVPVFNDGKRLSLRQLATTPMVIACVVGFGMFLLNIRIPSIAMDLLGYLTAINTPLSMIASGVFVSRVDFRALVRDGRIWLAVLLRNILFPLLVLGILLVSRVSVWMPGGATFGVAVMITVSCATAASAILISARYGKDSGYAAQILLASTAVSVVSLPLIVLLAVEVL